MVTRLHRSAAAGRDAGSGSARVGQVLVAGDEVHVALGRAEISLTSGSLLQIDEHTRLALHAVDRVQVIDGRIFVRSAEDVAVVVEAGGKRLYVEPGSAAEVTTSNSNDLLVRVVSGDARIESRWGSDALAATQSAFVSGPTGQPFVSPWVASDHDGFYHWSGGRTIFLAPPPTFLPYAHPTYRQQEYERLLRSQRSARRRDGDVTRGDRHSDTQRRGADARGGNQARGTERRARNRDDGSVQPNDRRPSAKTPAVKARGAGAGVAVRPR